MLVIIFLGIVNLAVITLSDMWKATCPQDTEGCNMVALAAFSSYVWVVIHA